MSGESYAPRSPDLASFFAGSSSSPPKPQSWSNLPAPRHQGDTQPQQRAYDQPQLHLQPPPYAYANQPVTPISPYSQHPPSAESPYQTLYSAQAQTPVQTSPQGIYGQVAPLQTQQYYQSFPDSQYQQYSSPLDGPTSAYHHQQSQHSIAGHSQTSQDLSLQSASDITSNMPPRRPGSAKEAAPLPPLAAEASEIDPSPVRTKFPTARIKRIMQADDEVGKVAQQTPIAVGKALELFMVALVSKSADVARERSSKRVSAQMLKHVVESDDQWDFLRDIVSKISDEEKPAKGSAAGGAGGKAVKGESESEEEDEVIPEKKKRAGRKKKA